MNTLYIKKSLKNIGLLYNGNAHLKAWSVKKSYNDTIRHYAKKNLRGSFASLLNERTGNRIKRLKNLDRPLNIFFLGTDEQQDRSGIIQALERLGNLTYFTGTNGSYGQNQPGSPAERRTNNTKRFLKLFNQLSLQGETPDLLIAQTRASFIDPKVLTQIRETYGTLVVNIAMDDRHQYWGEKIQGEWDGTYGLIPHIDLALTAAPECVDWYLKEGCPAVFFPEASDPAIFHPMLELPKIHDVCFVGGRYGIREKIVLALRRASIRVTAYGDNWEKGRIATEDVPRLFAQSKIILGMGTIGHCHDFYALKMRDFDGPMSGSCYLTHDNNDLHKLYDVGKEIITYHTIDDCVDMARYYIRQDVEREAIAKAGYLRAAKEHTWDKRFDSLVALLTEDCVKNFNGTKQS